MCKKVIFLGAGASNNAGYPLASNLYNTLKEEAQKTLITNYKNSWGNFDKNLSKIKENYKDFRNCNDIEYLLTVMSLLQEFHNKKSDNIFDKINNHSQIQEIIEASDSNTLAQAYKTAKENFSDCIEKLFGYKNYEMGNSAFQYMSIFLKKTVSHGDTVITTNYDLLIERALTNISLWHIRDGWGFPVDLKSRYNRKKYSKNRLKNLTIQAVNWLNKQFKQDDIEEKIYKSKSSPIKVLKLHGSVGWHKYDTEVAVDTSVLHHIIPPERMFTYDPKDSPFSPENLLILPTFLKNYANKTLLEIWSQAAQSLHEAEEAHIVGFSLPDYDVNIKTLLLALRNKLNTNSCHVNVYVKKCDKAAMQRWKNFLGNKNTEIKSINSFREYCEELKN